MTRFSKRALFWAPRAVSIAFVGLLSLFALDVFGAGYGFWETLLALTMHLIPTFVLTAILALAWRREWIGTAAYGAAGILYVITVLPSPIPLGTKLIWMLVIAAPAFVIAVLFLVNWIKHDELWNRNGRAGSADGRTTTDWR